MSRFLFPFAAAALVATSASAQIPAAEFAARRDSLASRVGDGIVVGFGGRTPVSDFGPFYQLPAFHYLTNFDEPDAAFVMVARAGRPTTTLFLTPIDPRRAFYYGRRPDSTSVERTLGVRARSFSALAAVMDSLASTGLPVYHLADFEDADFARQDSLTRGRAFMRSLATRHPGLVVRDAHAIVDRLRARKSPAELALIREAARISAEGHRAAMQAPQPAHEYEVQAVLEYTFRRLGAARPAYGSIVGAGANGTQLHYMKDRAPARPGDLIVMDAAAEYEGYAADVTRTMPVSGTFTTEQRAIYQLVRDAQAAAERNSRIGLSARAAQDSSVAIRAKGLAALGLVETADATFDPPWPADCARQPAQCRQAQLWMIHGISHGIGLAVHDPAQFYYDDRTFMAGDAFTIEPGIYVSSAMLDVLPDTPRNRAFIAKVRPVVARYENTGVRIEDDYVITERGTERISPAPREIDEIEAIMRNRPERASAPQTGSMGSMAGRSPVYAPNGVAATSQPLATTAAIDALQHGGNAIDAAVTAAAVLSVVEPMMTGIGGDMFALIWIAKEHRLVALNASGRAGALMTREELLRRGRTTRIPRGAETVTVPGALMGWQTLLDRYGTMSLGQALQPAIRYAEHGFVVTPVIAGDWAAETSVLRRDPGARATFLRDGMPPKAGDWFTNADYARTLRQIAAEGPKALYGGTLGKRIVDRVRELGGFLTLQDLRDNAPTWVTPISVPFKGYRIWELPPNNQGIATLEMLRILEPYDLASLGHDSAPYLHLLIEAKKLAYADLAQYDGDPQSLTLSPAAILSDAFIAERRSHIDPRRAMVRANPGPARVSSETVYLTVADKDGNMVSFINSLFDAFGSGIVAPGTGFALQDRGAGFTLTPGLPNTVAPGKRPFHTLIPGFVTIPGARAAADGSGDEPYMSFGLMGGAMQAQGHAQFLINHLVFGMNVQEAMDAVRFRHVDSTRVLVEAPLPDGVVAALRALGHDVVVGRPDQFGGSQAIIRLKHGYVAGSDPRKDGHAAGY